MPVGNSIVSFIVTLWQEPSKGRSEGNEWRGTIRSVTPVSSEEAAPPTPFRGISGVVAALRLCLKRMGVAAQDKKES